MRQETKARLTRRGHVVAVSSLSFRESDFHSLIEKVMKKSSGASFGGGDGDP